MTMKLHSFPLTAVFLALMLPATACSLGATGTAELVDIWPSGTSTPPTPTPSPAAIPSPSPTSTPSPRVVQTSSWTLPCDMNVFSAQWFSQGRHHTVRWSPDASQILFDRDPFIFAVDAKGQVGSPRLVVDASWEVVSGGEVLHRRTTRTSFDVSPDGRIAFSRCEDGRANEGYKFLNDDPHSRAVLSEGGSYMEVELVAARRHRWKIAVANIDGTNVETLTYVPQGGGGDWPSWSPDGSRVAYVGDWVSSSDDPTLYSMAADRSDEFPLIASSSLPEWEGSGNRLANFPPVWSPDGRHLATLNYLLSEVYTVRSDGSDLTMIVAEALSAPSWSPDSQRIAVAVSDGEGGAVLRTFAPDGSDSLTLGNILGAPDDLEYTWSHSRALTFLVRELSWSPDGSKIMYVCGAEVCAVDATDGSLAWIFTTQHNWPVAAWSPDWNFTTRDNWPVAAWSPDGSKVAVVGTTERGHLSLYTMNSDGTDVQTIISDWCVPESQCDIDSRYGW